MRLYNFTGAKHACENLKQRQIKVSLPNEVNDVYELRPFDFGGNEFRQMWEESIAGLSTKRGFVSFSEHWSSPAMWGHYADNHRGVCYGFDVPSIGLTRIRYVKNLRSFDKEALRNTDILKSEMDYALETKFAHWYYENEWRQYVTLNDDEIEKIYIDGKNLFFGGYNDNLIIREVIIGCKSDITRSQIENALQEEHEVEIRTARPSPHGYQIIEEK